MKAIWSGSMTFGLVSIPIKLYSAIEKQVLGFKMLCGKCHSPIKYKRWCPHCKKEVPWADIVKGIEVKKDKYVILTKEKIEELKPEKSEEITISEFIDKDTLDSIYIENHYYIGPKTSKEKVYFLFKDVLEKSNKLAIGTFVMKDKGYVCAIEPYKGVLLLNTLNYAYEIRSITPIEKPISKPKIEKKEIALAETLIKKMYKKKFNISKFKYTFAQKIKKAIEQAAKGKKIKITLPKKKKVVKKESLMEILQKSIRK